MVVEPIKDQEKLNILFRSVKNPRNKLMLVIAYYACLRISDVLKIRKGDLKKWRLEIKEQKTKKTKLVVVNQTFREFIDYLLPMWEQRILEKWKMELTDEDYVFISQKSKKYHMTREQAYRIISKEAKKAGINTKIGTHTMRKSAAYHAYLSEGFAGAQEILNHTDLQETRRYLGLSEEYRQEVYKKIANVVKFSK